MNCLIIDDEIPAIEELEYFIIKHSQIEISGKFTSGAEALLYLNENSVDVIFVDINMPMINGLEFSKIIKKFSRPPLIVFVTADKSYALDAIELEVFNFLLKPYPDEKVISLLKKIEKELKCIKENICLTNPSYESEKITVFKDDKVFRVYLEEILYFEASGKQTFCYTKNDVYYLKKSLGKVNELIENNKFFKCHKSFIIQIDKIEEIIPWFNSTFLLKFEGLDNKVTVSRNYSKHFKEIINLS